MSIHAGSIIHVSGRTVIQRIQSAGLGNVRMPVETIREVGNELVVDKVPGEPDYTFSMESLDVSTEIEALLHGKFSTAGYASGAAIGLSDAPGTAYDFSSVRPINILSPWKDTATGSAGSVAAGHILPAYYPTRIRYRFGVQENAMQTVELAGGTYYYGKFAPLEDTWGGDGATTVFNTSQPAVQYRKGGVGGTTFRNVFGVLVNGISQVEGVDYDVTGGGPAATAAAAQITFTVPPPALDGQGNATVIRAAYFTTTAQSFPQAVHANAIVLPGAVRGRNICVSVASGGATAWERIGAIQTVELDATVETQVERELCNDVPVGRTINGIDVNGNMVIRAKDVPSFFSLLQKITGLNTAQEVVGFLNVNPVRLKIEIQNPRNPGAILKTLYVSDAIFDMPGTPARVNTPTDFTLEYHSQGGDYTAYTGAAAV